MRRKPIIVQRGVSKNKREIWKIPEFVLEDKNGVGKYVIKNLLVAIVPDAHISIFSMILTSQVFYGSSYHIFDKKDDKMIEIYPEYENRAYYCIPAKVKNRDELTEDEKKDIDLKEDEFLVSAVTVFAEGSEDL